VRAVKSKKKKGNDVVHFVVVLLCFLCFFFALKGCVVSSRNEEEYGSWLRGDTGMGGVGKLPSLFFLIFVFILPNDFFLL
jgi:hypothetical protein